MSTSPSHVDYFVSYNHRDEQWATWIAWQLEQAGFTTAIQAWDFRPGNNFVHEMQEAATKADRTILVLTDNYLQSNFTQPEWYAAFAQDPKGAEARVIPVRVEPCNPAGLLGQIVYIDLVGKDVKEAATALLSGIAPGRAKPAAPPAFPGAATSTAKTAPVEPTLSIAAAHVTTPDWRRLPSTPAIRWRPELSDGRWGPRSGPAILELHLLPTDTGLLEVRRLAGLANELAELGRSSGLFTVTQQLRVQSTGDLSVAETTVERDIVDTGLVVTREQQRGAWVTLPTDGLGSVFDPAEVRARLEALLQTLLRIDIPAPQRFAVAAGIAHTMMLSVGSSDIVGRRNTASMRTEGGDIRVAPDEDVSTTVLRQAPADIAEEITARLMSELGATSC